MIPILALACAVRSSNLARCTWFFFCPLDKIFQSKKLIVFSFFTLNYMQCFLILFVFDFRRYIKAIIYIAAASSWWHATNFLKCGIKLLVLKLHYYFRLNTKRINFQLNYTWNLITYLLFQPQKIFPKWRVDFIALIFPRDYQFPIWKAILSLPLCGFKRDFSKEIALTFYKNFLGFRHLPRSRKNFVANVQTAFSSYKSVLLVNVRVLWN